jgi:hypothetical protein
MPRTAAEKMMAVADDWEEDMPEYIDMRIYKRRVSDENERFDMKRALPTTAFVRIETIKYRQPRDRDRQEP